jgi:hypothetical protein
MFLNFSNSKLELKGLEIERIELKPTFEKPPKTN